MSKNELKANNDTHSGFAGLKISGQSPGSRKKTNFLTTEQSGTPQSPLEQMVG